jgi:hypothetical protein
VLLIGHHAVVLRDVLRQVRVVDGAAADAGVAVDVVVLRARAGGEREHHLEGVHLLPRARHLADRDEVDHGVDEHLRVDAEVPHGAVAEDRADGVRHAADADLQAGAVLDLGRDERGDLPVHLRRRGIRQLRERRVAPSMTWSTSLMWMDSSRPEDVRHRRAGLDDDLRRALRHRLRVPDGAAKLK